MSKTYFAYIYKPPTSFTVVKTHSQCSASLLHSLRRPNRKLHPSSSLLHDLRWLKRTFQTLQAFHMLYSVQNVHSEPTLASSNFSGGQNVLCELLQASYQHCAGQNAPSKVLQASYSLCCDQQNAPFVSLQASYPLFSGENALSKPQQASYTLCGVENVL